MFMGSHELNDLQGFRSQHQRKLVSVVEMARMLKDLPAWKNLVELQVLRALSRALSRATSQPPSVAAEQQDSTVRRTEDAAENKEPTKTRSTLFPETVDTLPLSETVDKKLAIVGGEAANEMRCRNRN